MKTGRAFLVVLCVIVFACSDEEDTNEEIIPTPTTAVESQFEKISLGASPANLYGGSFTIDHKAYLLDHKNVWSYDPATNTWLTKNEFPGVARERASGFAINGKGYMCFGFGPGGDIETSRLKEVWEYDPSTDEWTQLEDFPGVGRYEAVAQVVGNEAYVGFGMQLESSTAYNDFWKFNPATGEWTELPSDADGEKRGGAVSFAIDNKIYISTGALRHAQTSGIPSVSVYDIASGLWSEGPGLPAFPQNEKLDRGAAGYVLNGFGVTILAASGVTFSGEATVFVFDPEKSEWFTKRVAGIGDQVGLFVIDGDAYCKDLFSDSFYKIAWL